ncbi:MAG TPA: response regulator, partial [Candidatus Dormibacteraeota bacterium]|nr:response regulator [Candidatus Dormibacteraeota bacterium]
MLVIPRSREQGITRERVVTLKTLVIDPHSLFLAALGNLLSGHPLYAEVESTTNSSAGLHLIESGDYDLAFCDVTASPLSGPQVAAELRARGSSTRLILLADPDDFRLLLANLHCGASGFFTKNTSYEEL